MLRSFPSLSGFPDKTTPHLARGGQVCGPGRLLGRSHLPRGLTRPRGIDPISVWRPPRGWVS